MVQSNIALKHSIVKQPYANKIYLKKWFKERESQSWCGKSSHLEQRFTKTTPHPTISEQEIRQVNVIALWQTSAVGYLKDGY